jgi:hypothetical protein
LHNKANPFAKPNTFGAHCSNNIETKHHPHPFTHINPQPKSNSNSLNDSDTDKYAKAALNFNAMGPANRI